MRQQFVREGVALANTKQSGGLFVGKAATGGNPVTCTNKKSTTLAVVPFLFIRVVGFEEER